MNESQANKAVFITAGVLIAATFVEIAYAPNKPNPFKRMWGIGILTLVLAITADFVPEVAGPLALLILTSVAVNDSKYFSQAFDMGSEKKVVKA